jgi:hypothetical protein
VLARWSRDKASPGWHYAFATLASARRQRIREGDLATAMNFSDQAVSIDEAAVRPAEGIFYLPMLHHSIGG